MRYRTVAHGVQKKSDDKIYTCPFCFSRTDWTFRATCSNNLFIHSFICSASNIFKKKHTKSILETELDNKTVHLLLPVIKNGKIKTTRDLYYCFYGHVLHCDDSNERDIN